MEFEFSNKLNYFETGIFNILNDKKNELISQGKKVYNLSVGTPDFKPDEHVMKALAEASLNPENWKYSLGDNPKLIEAMQNFYKKRFNVNLNEDEIMSVYGSQEGLTHIGFSLINEGDVVLVPNPGYPIFEIGPFLASAEIYHDIFSGETIPYEAVIMTDGKYRWASELLYYVERYNLQLETEFVNIALKDKKVPDE